MLRQRAAHLTAGRVVCGGDPLYKLAQVWGWYTETERAAGMAMKGGQAAVWEGGDRRC